MKIVKKKALLRYFNSEEYRSRMRVENRLSQSIMAGLVMFGLFLLAGILGGQIRENIVDGVKFGILSFVLWLAFTAIAEA